MEAFPNTPIPSESRSFAAAETILPVDTSQTFDQQQQHDVITTTELAVLCLDFLQSVRKHKTTTTTKHTKKQLPTNPTSSSSSSSYWTVACWALHRALSEENSDKENNHNNNANAMILPSVSTMNMELEDTANAVATKQYDTSDEKKEDHLHHDNYMEDEYASQRFYTTYGLSERALTMPEIVAAGVAGLHARSRLAAEKEMVESPLFHHFLQAVQAKGFFDNNNNSKSHEDNESSEERYQKVVTKFRQKLCQKMESSFQHGHGATTGELVAVAAADHQRRRSRDLTADVAATTSGDKALTDNPIDLEEAEKLKNAGNVHMQKKEYELAAQCYTKALKLCPAGIYSHVYYSNRAAALVSMKKFQEAILDSERALALKPDYGKAHARLGLAHFLLGDYRQAMEAYTVSLKYEPDNKSSRNYLEKSAKRLAEAGEDYKNHYSMAPSFSVVSEWDKKGGGGANTSLNTSQQHHNHSIHQQPSQTFSPEKQSSVSKSITNQDEREAEKFKIKGNSLMANRNYAEAAEAYSKAIALHPKGAQSHVYYSNRAAAYCYLERYSEAAQDSLQSLALNPRYGKAHARLGLSRFFMHDYEGAVEAYTNALEYDPENAASKSYLAKAQAKLKQQQASR